MAARIRAFDWAGTALGPFDGWPQSLHTAAEICLRCRFPMVIFWGPQFLQLYNDSYREILGAKHPAALGQPAAVCWAEIWSVIGEMLTGVMDRGESTFDEDLRLDVRRYGTVEEAYFTFSYSPVLVASGEVGGVFCAVAETTGTVIGARRLAALRDVGADTAGARSARQACELAACAMDAHRADVPYGLVYLAAAGRAASLVASWGLPTPVPAQYAQIDLDDPAAALPLGHAQAREVALTVEQPPDLPAPAVVVLPVCPSGDSGPPVFLVAGISPLRELDGAYRSFLDVLAGQLTAAVTAAHAYASAQQRAQALAELDRAKTEFFSNVSHEFRTPLTLIMGPVAELRAIPEVDPRRLRTELDVIHRNGLRLGKLVNTLLEFSRLQAGRIHARYEPLDVGAFTAELASVFRSAIERAGLRLEVNCADLEQPVYLDREMWEKVILNLLSNALKFTFDGHITVTVRRVGKSVGVTVADTGTGIPTEELPRLFERFHRIRGARARSHEGSGIGLALVAELVALHGGTITANSTPEVGTTFTVTLPLGSAHLPADQIVAASTVTGASQGAAPFVEEALRWLADAPQVPEDAGTGLAGAQPLGPAGTRVLLADDNADMRDYVQRLLASRYHVQTVPDGLAALHTARTDPPDLIIADVMMPGMDGLELLAALRADPRTARVPVLLLSARAGGEAAAEGLAAGADDYLVKPFTAGELLARVSAHLQLDQLRRQGERRLELLQQATAALSAAATPAEVSQVAITHLGYLLDAPATTLYELREPGALEWVAGRGVAPELARTWSTLPLSSPIAFADAARRHRPVWLESLADCQPYPGMAALAAQDGYPAHAGLPLVIGQRCLGVLVALFDRPRQFTQAERTAAVSLAGQCAQALDRARLYRAEHTIAETLQRSLLPGQLPEFDRLALAARYLPGALEGAAGGDWYDVLALDEQRLAIVVGDVVGKGAVAAAVMGQLRTALAAYLLEGHGPAAALERLDRLAARIPGALASTAAVMILDLGSGQLCWTRAGHPPPLLIEPDALCYLTEGAGGPLGVPRRPPYPEATTQITPGTCLLLYTDGLIERRGQILDEGLDHLTATATALGSEPPSILLEGLLAHALPEAGPADDIALIAVRYLPAPLHQRLPADLAQLLGLRRAVRAWTRAGALPTALSEDLQITLGEAAANAAEHAYASASEPGEFTYRLTRRGDGAIEVEMRDFGRWRPEPPDNHHRGRGLAMIRAIATDVVIDPSPAGTQVRFRLPAPPPDPEPPAPTRQPQPSTAAPPAPAQLHIDPQPDGGRRLQLRGELDLTAAATLRDHLLDQLHPPGPVTLDLRALDYLSSAGVGLLIHAAQHAESHHIPLQLQLAPHSIPARVLALTGLEATLPMTTVLISTDQHG